MSRATKRKSDRFCRGVKKGANYLLHPAAPPHKHPASKRNTHDASITRWGHSSDGRALEWHSRGREFDPPWLHQHKADRDCGSLNSVGAFVIAPAAGWRGAGAATGGPALRAGPSHLLVSVRSLGLRRPPDRCGIPGDAQDCGPTGGGGRLWRAIGAGTGVRPPVASDESSGSAQSCRPTKRPEPSFRPRARAADGAARRADLSDGRTRLDPRAVCHPGRGD